MEYSGDKTHVEIIDRACLDLKLLFVTIDWQLKWILMRRRNATFIHFSYTRENQLKVELIIIMLSYIN